MGRCGICACRFSERFKQANLQSHWLSKIACFRQPIRLQICILKFARNAVKSGKSESRIVPCKNLTNLQKFFVFFSFYKLVSQVKIHLVCRKDIVDFISVIILA